MLTLEAQIRDIYKKKLKSSRGEGLLPAVMYGPKDKAQSIFIGERDFYRVWKEAGESTVIGVKLGGEEKEVLIHEVDMDPVKDVPRHADFYILEKGKEITVSIPLEFVGEAPAVKNLGGTVVKVMHELEIKVLPKDLPHSIEVDVTSLENLESQIAIHDLRLPEGVKPTANADDVVAAIATQQEEDETEAEPADISSIEVEKKGKTEEGGADQGEEKKEESA